METLKLVKFVVTKQGGPILNDGCVVVRGKDVHAIEIDMKSKYCDVLAESETAYGAPVILLSGKGALRLKPGHEKEETEVAFPDYEGWDIFLSEACRYTLRVVFVRNR